MIIQRPKAIRFDVRELIFDKSRVVPGTVARGGES
jgi:hypothetical protein